MIVNRRIEMKIPFLFLGTCHSRVQVKGSSQAGWRDLVYLWSFRTICYVLNIMPYNRKEEMKRWSIGNISKSRQKEFWRRIRRKWRKYHIFLFLGIWKRVYFILESSTINLWEMSRYHILIADLDSTWLGSVWDSLLIFLELAAIYFGKSNSRQLLFAFRVQEGSRYSLVYIYFDAIIHSILNLRAVKTCSFSTTSEGNPMMTFTLYHRRLVLLCDDHPSRNDQLIADVCFFLDLTWSTRLKGASHIVCRRIPRFATRKMLIICTWLHLE